jgi:DNA repair protein RadC
METRNSNLVLVREKKYNTNFCCKNPKDVVKFCINNLKLRYAPEEYVYVIALNTPGDIIGLFEVSHGCINASICSPREIFIRLLLCGAAQFICVHNHPSGNTIPSNNDKNVFNHLCQSGLMLNLPMADYIIVGRNETEYTSFKERGDL